MQYYSQFGQDKYLHEKYYQGKTDGVFIDIGAHDGITGSNTYLFEQLGWQGICFEPVPDIFDRLKANRKCQLRNLALSNSAGSAYFKYIKGHSEMLSGLISEYSAPHLARIEREFAEHEQVEEIIRVHTKLFNTEVPFKHIDVLSIDVEGAEETIIKTIDFNMYDISFMVVEFNEGSSNELQNYIEKQGFYLECRMGCDLIFKNYNV